MSQEKTNQRLDLPTWELVTNAPKRLFKNYISLNTNKTSRGFSIDRVTVLFSWSKNDMKIMHFPENGRQSEVYYIMPKSERELIKKLVHHCGVKAIESQFKNNVTVI